MRRDSASQHDVGNHLAKHFTLPGRILVVATLILAAEFPQLVRWISAWLSFSNA